VEVPRGLQHYNCDHGMKLVVAEVETEASAAAAAVAVASIPCGVACEWV